MNNLTCKENYDRPSTDVAVIETWSMIAVSNTEQITDDDEDNNWI